MIKFLLWSIFMFILGVGIGGILVSAVVVASKCEEDN